MRVPFVLAFGFVVLLLAEPAQSVEVRPALGFGYDFGGEKIHSFTKKDGSLGQLDAGTGFSFTLGALFKYSQTKPHAFEFEVGTGPKFTSSNQSATGDVDFWRWPIHLINYYRNTIDLFRIGFGPVYYVENNVTVKNVGQVARFKNVLGFTVRIEKLTDNGKAGFGATYNMVKFERDNGLGNPVNGDGLGFFGAAYF
ncbi:MAG: hypothetical protein V4692_06785 [Bdellovibrionota bacterium]